MTEDPFEWIPNPPKRKPKPKEKLESWPTDRSKIMGKRKRKPLTNHNARTLEHYEKQGYLAFKVEGKKSVGPGATVTLDFLGLFDFMAIKVGTPDIGIQVSAQAAVPSHLSKMTSTQLTGFNNRQRIQNLISWLETGHRAVIIGWEKVGARWVATEKEVSLEYAYKALARKRGQGVA